MHRARVVLSHLQGAPRGLRAQNTAAPGDPDQDIVVVHGRRTPICKAKRGGFKETAPDELLSAVMSAVLKDLNLSPDKIGDICVGNVLQPGAGALVARIAQFMSGIPETVPNHTINRQCSSGLQAIIDIAGGIRNGSYDLGLACGVESMSLRSVGQPGDISARSMDFQKARDCTIPMGITSENVAERFGVTRQKQDMFALSSQQKAAAAQQAGRFRNEIVPVTTTFTDDQGNSKTITVTSDEGVRASTTLEGLNKLRPAFKEDGSTTAGNSSQAVYCVEKLGIPLERVNPNGGAIALGHPLGCTGARQTVTLLNELKRRGKRSFGVVSMCIGTGMGAAAVFEYPGN
uniref:Acetyl-CoA acyltransferase 1 n=1 Tax=Leptobrachium leishanense TaxID=445787 RepID=A0A8C5WHF1_9ANUR